MRLIQPDDYRRTRWKNDGGWTTELARSAENANAETKDFLWRVSIAEIEHDGPFSSFPRMTRDLLLLDGKGVELDIDGHPPWRLSRRFERAHFDGASNVRCRLLAGPTRDFNVMACTNAVRAEVVARPLVGPMVIFPQERVEWLIHVLAGNAIASGSAETINLTTGTSLYVDFRNTDFGRVMFDGVGELALVKFTSGSS